MADGSGGGGDFAHLEEVVERARVIPGETRVDLDAERAVLSAVLLDDGATAAFVRMRSIVSDEDFFEPRHGLIWSAMVAVADRSEPIDHITLAAELRARNRLNTVGGSQYIAELVDAIPTVAHCEAHAELVAQCALYRRAESNAWALLTLSRSVAATPEELQAQSRKLVDALVARNTESLIESLDALCEREVARFEDEIDKTVIPTGIAPIDKAMAGGLRGGELIIPCGRPGSGKSSLAMQLAVSIAERGETVIFVSLEMPADQVFMRLAAQMSGVDIMKIRGRAMNQTECNAYFYAMERLRKLPLRIIASASVKPSQLRALVLAEKARLATTGQRIGLVVYDYLQRGQPERREEKRELEISSIARALKTLAVEALVPVCAPAQINRDVDKRGEKEEPDAPPIRLSDLRESGSIEQEADVVIGLYEPRSAPNVRRCYLLKQRNGAKTTEPIPLVWEGWCARFAARPDEEPMLPVYDDSPVEDPTFGSTAGGAA